MTAIFLYLLVLFAAFALLNVLLHREVRSERRREDERPAPRDVVSGPAERPRSDSSHDSPGLRRSNH